MLCGVSTLERQGMSFGKFYLDSYAVYIFDGRNGLSVLEHVGDTARVMGYIVQISLFLLPLSSTGIEDYQKDFP